jgi:hypothetical protein
MRLYFWLGADAENFAIIRLGDLLEGITLDAIPA